MAGASPLTARFAIALVACSAASVQAESWRIIPTVSLSETYSDNMALVADAGAKEGLISTISPAFRAAGAGSRVSGYFDYRHDESYYHGLSASNAGRDYLSSYANAKVIDDWFLIEGSAAVTPRSRSIFSQNTTSSENALANQDETRVVQISPYFQGQLLGTTETLLRLTSVDARSESNTAFRRTKVDQLVSSMRNPAARGSVGWFADFNGSRVNSSSVGKRTDSRLRGGVIFSTLPHLRLLAFTGRERTDIAASQMESYANPGFGFEWQPSNNTQATGMSEKRFFGRSHNFSFLHRTPFTAWRYTDVKDVALLPMGLAGFNRGSVYDLMSDLLTISISDPVARDEAARTRTALIGGMGTGVDLSGALVSRIFMDRTRQGSFALLGRRDIITMILQQRDEQLLNAGPSFVQDDFSLTPDIRDRNAILSWLHRLTPTVDLNVSAAYGKRYSLSVDDLEATQQSAIVELNFRLTPTTRAALRARNTGFSRLGVSDSVRERALVGTLILGF